MVQNQDAFAHALDERQIMAGDEHGRADLLELAKQRHDFAGELRIEVTGRFVGDQHGGFGNDCARDADALLFAGRKRRRLRGLVFEQADLVERGPHALADLFACRAGDDERQRDVVEDAAVEQQAMVLKHHADAAAHTRNAAPAHLRQILAIDGNVSARRPFEQRDELQKCTFTGAGMAGEKCHFASCEFEAQLVERFVSGRIAFADAVKRDHLTI